MDYRHILTDSLQKAREILRCGRDLITPLENWTQGTQATNRSGSVVGVKDEEACCFCAVGALNRCDPAYSPGSIYGPQTPVHVAKRCLDDLVVDDIIYFNDRRSGLPGSVGHARRHKLVLGKFDDALERIDRELAKRGATA